jgi:putative tryptophan/tyrosine transport system substrate-binding protein
LAFGGATLIWPRAAIAQTTSRLYRVGVLSPGAAQFESSNFGPSIVRGFERHGYALGRNLEFERRGAETHTDRFPRLVEELVAAKVDVILTVGYPAALAAKQGTTVVPIVVTEPGGDPVATGLVDSLSRPGANLTGVSDVAIELTPKRIQLLKEIVPGLRSVAMLWNETDRGMTLRYRDSAAAAEALGIIVQPMGVRDPDDFERAFASMILNPPDAILMVSDLLTHANRRRVHEFAMTRRLPCMYEKEFLVREGGLMTYAPDLDELYGRATGLVDRILKGAKPADLPFEQPTRFRLLINNKTAKALGFTIPQSLLLRADEVIE